jgi:hypothetical protein
VLALSVIDFFKIQVRSEPLVITDFGLTEEVGNVAAATKCSSTGRST